MESQTNCVSLQTAFTLLRLCDFFSELREFLGEESLQRDGTLGDLGVWLVEEAAVLEDPHDVTDELAQLVVLPMVDAILDGLKICNC